MLFVFHLNFSLTRLSYLHTGAVWEGGMRVGEETFSVIF